CRPAGFSRIAATGCPPRSLWSGSPPFAARRWPLACSTGRRESARAGKRPAGRCRPRPGRRRCRTRGCASAGPGASPSISPPGSTAA
ncbi:MAG: hypothetical protein AVDCRST_MAG08-1820, partial [uncultured Acetobacteraceae bacterium]